MSHNLKISEAGRKHLLAEIDEIQGMLCELHQLVVSGVRDGDHDIVYNAARDSLDALKTMLQIEWYMVNEGWVEADKREYPLPF